MHTLEGIVCLLDLNFKRLSLEYVEMDITSGAAPDHPLKIVDLESYRKQLATVGGGCSVEGNRVGSIAQGVQDERTGRINRRGITVDSHGRRIAVNIIDGNHRGGPRVAHTDRRHGAQAGGEDRILVGEVQLGGGFHPIVDMHRIVGTKGNNDGSTDIAQRGRIGVLTGPITSRSHSTGSSRLEGCRRVIIFIRNIRIYDRVVKYHRVTMIAGVAGVHHSPLDVQVRHKVQIETVRTLPGGRKGTNLRTVSPHPGARRREPAGVDAEGLTVITGIDAEVDRNPNGGAVVARRQT